MRQLLTIPLVLGGLATGLVFAAPPAQAHCDSENGPVATAALKALEAKNVNLVLPYAPATAEPELTSAFQQAIAVRGTGPVAKSLADRYFMETAVRLHRAGENAPYDGLKPAGTDHGLAIPAAEKAIETGATGDLIALLSEELARGINARFEHVLHSKELPAKATDKSTVPAARERVKAELAFVTYVQGVYAATKGGAHAE